MYDRFNLGSATNPTRYGTPTGLTQMIEQMHRIGTNVYIDLVWNHNGTSDQNTTSGSITFQQAALIRVSRLRCRAPTRTIRVTTRRVTTIPTAISTIRARRLTSRVAWRVSSTSLRRRTTSSFAARSEPIRATSPPAPPASLDDRRPTCPRQPTRSFTRIATWAARRCSIRRNTNVTVYQFNNANPMAGDAVPENATGYLMRRRWMRQVIGVDGFRIDAAKEMPSWVMQYYDEAMAGTGKTLLDGTSLKQPFAFSELYTGDKGLIQQYIRKDSNTVPANQVSGNRDVLDFPLYFAMSSNLTNNGLSNDWRKREERQPRRER